MALSSGTRLGPYEVLAPLGAGGMGEVYRAKDTRLEREVAVKVLPASYARDADRLRRFEQEARAAGQLNHPNIVVVHDFGTYEGAPYVVQELLEGETLRERLGGTALAPRKAIEYSVQIAHGLAAAHEKGIVHRDLKPENLFVTKDGRIKILDFGLAKLIRPEGVPGGETSLPTSPGATDPGLVLGTVGYMSPEQVRGRPADHRSDIFSFGAILYEMLSGKRAFKRDTAAEMMTAILKEEPPDLSETNRNISPGVERVVTHCLEKNPEQRFQSARDLAFDLEVLSGISGAAPPPRALEAERAGRSPWLLVVALALLVSYVGVFFLGRRAGEKPSPAFHQLAFRRGIVRTARFAPDGQTVVYSAAWEGNPVELFSTNPESPESRALGFPRAEVVSIYRSGEMALVLNRRMLGGWMRVGTLARMPLAGGAPRDILEDVQGADWAPDGASLAVARAVGGRYRLEFPIGKVLYETGGWISDPRVSPKGNMVAFLDHPILSDDRGSVAVVDRAGKVTRLAGEYSSAAGLAWPRAGDEVWFTATEAGANRALFGVTLSGRKRLIARVPGALTLQDVSRDGRVLLTRDDSRRGIIGLTPGETTERDLSWLDWSYPRDFSSDGRTILFDEQGEGAGGKYVVYARKTDGSAAVRLGEGYAIGFSPEGKWALSIIPYALPPQLVLWPTGAGEPKPIPSNGVECQWASWFPDGKRLLLWGSEPGRGMRLYVQDLAGGKPRPITPEGVGVGQVSPDGRWIVTVDPDDKLVLYSVEGGEPQAISGAAAGDIPVRWGAGGHILFVAQRGELSTKVYRLDVITGLRQLWRHIVPSDPTGIDSVGPICLTPDGKSYAYGYIRILSGLFMVEGLK